MKFRYHERVKVINGFYKSFNGIVYNYQEKDNKIYYNVELMLNSKVNLILIPEDDLRKLSFIESIFKI